MSAKWLRCVGLAFLVVSPLIAIFGFAAQVLLVVFGGLVLGMASIGASGALLFSTSAVGNPAAASLLPASQLVQGPELALLLVPPAPGAVVLPRVLEPALALAAVLFVIGLFCQLARR